MRERFSTFNNLLEGVQLLNAQMVYEYVNTSAGLQMKKNTSFLLGKSFSDAHPGIEKSDFYKDLLVCLEQKTEKISVVEFQHLDGSVSYYEMCIKPYSKGLLILSVDVSAQKRLEKELELLNKKFEDELKERMKNIVVNLEIELNKERKQQQIV